MEVRYADWIFKSADGPQCSQCGQNGYEHWRFCPNCGREMLNAKKFWNGEADKYAPEKELPWLDEEAYND